jgi:sn-1 stearoyl-lipid 9-desaturase
MVKDFMAITFLTAFVIFYLWHIMGVTIGYHRLLSHRSFRCLKIVEYFWVLGGYLAFEGSPIWWATTHRAHHRYTDQQLDPHSPRYGWMNAYYGWIFSSRYQDYISPRTQAKDLVKDPVYRFLEQNGNWHRAHILAVSIGIAFRIMLLLCLGWTIALASLAAGVLVQQVPLLLNVVCHLPKLGYKNYQTGEDSVNVWWVALLTAGEGWHNNHHAFPGSARSGFKRFEIDPSWLMIRFMKLLGLVEWLHEESTNSIYEPGMLLSDSPG